MSKTNKPLRVLISHSSRDQQVARELYLQLNAEGWMDLWFIESNLKPSQNWDFEIRAAVENANVVIALLSKNSTKSEAYFYPSPSLVHDMLQSRLKKKVIVIPLKLENTKIPTNFETSDAINYFPKNQRQSVYSQVLERLRTYAAQHGFPMDSRVQDVVLEQGLQWSPRIWKEQGGFDEEVLDDEYLGQKLTLPPSKLKKVIFGGFNILSCSLLTIGVLTAVAVGRLTLNYFFKFETGSRNATPVISQGLTIAPLPTPTLGVGSTRISPRDGMQTVFVPAGEFIMGGDVYFDERPIRLVTLDAFWIDKTEVTNAMFADFLNQWGNREEGGEAWLDTTDEDVRIHLIDGFWRSEQVYENHPVVEVTWFGANAYCSWAGRRLPTEAEWEKSARGMKGNVYPWGDDDPTEELLNFNKNVGDTTEVGSYPEGASPFGALDMAGNAWEWVADRYSRTYYSSSPLENPLGPDTGFFRVLRGGGWNYRDTYVRSMHRNRGAPTISHDFVGFRCGSSDQ